MANDKIDVVWDSVLDEVLGSENPASVTGVRLRNIKTDAVSDLAVDGVFIAIGHDPATKLFRGKLDMDEDGMTMVFRVQDPGMLNEQLQRQNIQRLGTPREMAYAVLFLACAESSYVTGTVLVADGGWTLR